MTETSIFRPHFSVTSLLMHDAIMNMSRFRPFVSFVIFSLPPSPLGTYHHHRLTDWLAGAGATGLSSVRLSEVFIHKRVGSSSSSDRSCISWQITIHAYFTVLHICSGRPICRYLSALTDILAIGWYIGYRPIREIALSVIYWYRPIRRSISVALLVEKICSFLWYYVQNFKFFSVEDYLL